MNLPGSKFALGEWSELSVVLLAFCVVALVVLALLHLAPLTRKLWAKTPDGIGWVFLAGILWYAFLIQGSWQEELYRLREEDVKLVDGWNAINRRVVALTTPPAEFQHCGKPLWLWKRKAKQIGWE